MEKLGVNVNWLIAQVINAILILTLALPVVAVPVFGFLFFRLLRGWNRPLVATSAPGETPLDIARARYARGEITREQLEQLRQDLEG